jgi:hypothetical protein
MSGYVMSLFPENENGTNGPDKYLCIYVCSSCETTKQDMKRINHRGSKRTVVGFLKHDNDIKVNQDTKN